ncbi:DUF4232 domain-containing protein [Actinoplanes derwentensis]|uniref:DUF4232 domain-containing protein n=1 Tax=Actinoplanes derwentensis TaxID=113562 RepID=A0A1H2BFQ9_9ACTN|nr:DUF4232 domain-containing protein [Actinoplanes derwentensis]GID87781.1 hypothetical protein Ade03nite_67050 [Actinoplanes derwentensis]SDT57028.1 Protein of unknown function [Actinoplanes derwentensis]
MLRYLVLSLVLLLTACARPPLADEPGTGRRSAPPVPGVSASVTVVRPAVPRCVQGARIALSETEGAMGLRATGIELYNCGKKSFTVDGYPVLDVLGEDRAELDVQTLHGVEKVHQVEQWIVSPKRITVRPGESARALLLWRNLTTDKVETGAFVSIAAAEGQPRHVLAEVVDVGSTGKVAVSPWVADAKSAEKTGRG